MSKKFRSILEGTDPLGRYLLRRIIYSELEQFLKYFDAPPYYKKTIILRREQSNDILQRVEFVYGQPKEVSP